MTPCDCPARARFPDRHDPGVHRVRSAADLVRIERLCGIDHEGLLGSGDRLKVHRSQDLDLCHGCHEIAEKSSKIVPLGAPLFEGPARTHGLHNVLI